MTDKPLYHDGMRQLQDVRETRALADRLEQVIVRPAFTAEDRIFPNCPRYLHKMQVQEYSSYAPRACYTPPVPGWKSNAQFRDYLPGRDRPEPGEEPDSDVGAPTGHD